MTTIDWIVTLMCLFAVAVGGYYGVRDDMVEDFMYFFAFIMVLYVWYLWSIREIRNLGRRKK